jgi:hypothetical protein
VASVVDHAHSAGVAECAEFKALQNLQAVRSQERQSYMDFIDERNRLLITNYLLRDSIEVRVFD